MEAKLQAIDPTILTDVVRQDQRSPLFQITQWSVERLSGKGIINPDGLWRFSGEGRDRGGDRSWSVVLKILRRQEQEPPLDDMWHWKRELLLVQSGLLERLPGPVKAPRFYRAEETPGGAWLWLEYIKDRRPAQPWGLADYAFAARQLGAWHGRCVALPSIPAEPWLVRQHVRSWNASIDPERDLQFPLNQKHIVGDLRRRYEQLWADRERLYDLLERLPQTFSHFDCQRRNLFIRKGESAQDELVLVDWALCGLGPIGAELSNLVGMTTVFLEWPASQLAQLDKTTFENYLQGLHEAGWSGNPDLVRLGTVAWVAAWIALIYPFIVAVWCSPIRRERALQQFGLAEQELYLEWLALLPYWLDCADETWLLAKKLRLL